MFWCSIRGFFLLTAPRRYSSFVDHLCYLCLVFVMLWCLFIATLRSPAGKGLASWLLFVMFIVFLLLSHVVSWVRFVMPNCDFATFPCGILGQVWYLIVLIPDLCRLSYFEYPQPDFWLKNTKKSFSITHSNLEACYWL